MEMLVAEHLVGADVAVAPREMSGWGRRLTGSGAARQCVHAHVVSEKFRLSQRKQAQLDAGGETTGVGKMVATLDLTAVNFWQTINIVVAGSRQAEVLSQVDNLHVGWYGMGAKKLLTLTMTETEEHNVYRIKWIVGAKLHFCVAKQTLVNVIQLLARIASAIGKHNLTIRVVQKQTDQFAACIACCS